MIFELLKKALGVQDPEGTLRLRKGLHREQIFLLSLTDWEVDLFLPRAPTIKVPHSPLSLSYFEQRHQISTCSGYVPQELILCLCKRNFAPGINELSHF